MRRRAGTGRSWTGCRSPRASPPSASGAAARARPGRRRRGHCRAPPYVHLGGYLEKHKGRCANDRAVKPSPLRAALLLGPAADGALDAAEDPAGEVGASAASQVLASVQARATCSK